MQKQEQVALDSDWSFVRNGVHRGGTECTVGQGECQHPHGSPWTESGLDVCEWQRSTGADSQAEQAIHHRLQNNARGLQPWWDGAGGEATGGHRPPWGWQLPIWEEFEIDEEDMH